ncbi:rRNA-processing protein MPP10 PWA37_000186 [Arxiozyma heterogenica]|uniref:rRNA-processing protein MPP10 n=1 Tax=Arxiozyma heterogenica TaxID=278026 RepID=UPI002F081E1F
MSSKILKLLNDNPCDLVSSNKSTNQSLGLVKQHMDSIIRSYKQLAADESFKIGLDQIIVDGLDANQVWWQAKTVLNSIEGDLINRIQDLQSIVSSNTQQENDDADDDDEEEEEEESQEEKGEDEESQEDEVEEEDDKKKEENEEVIEEEQSDLPSDVYEDAKENIFIHQNDSVSDNSSEKEEQEEDISEKDELNDKFFDIDEFNKQTLALENGNDLHEDQGDEDDDIDYFGDIPSEEEDKEEALYYDDFFDKPIEKKAAPNRKSRETNDSDFDELNESDYETAMDSVKLDLFEENNDSEYENDKDMDKLSSFEKQQLEIQRQIEQLEKEAVEEKKWALKGEVKAKDRPEDALLIEDLEFDRNSKPVPVITSSVTESLEEMIRDRIKNHNFDDLLKRTVVDIQNKKVKPDFELSDTKSAKSLAELYEDDYKGVDENMEINEELQKSHDEISELFANLTYKLDALSSAHFIPRPSKKTLEIRVDTAAIAMEDAQPLTMSSASTLAPQEIYSVTKSDSSNEIRLKDGTTMSRDELSREDKTRLRRAAKRKRAKQLAKQSGSVKKSKNDNIIETLSNAKNITIINKKGEKKDIKGNTISNQNSNANKIENIKL